MDWVSWAANGVTILTPTIALGALGYRSLRKGLHADIGRVETRINGLEKRMDLMESNHKVLEERMFFLATGKTLAEAMEKTIKREG